MQTDNVNKDHVADFECEPVSVSDSGLFECAPPADTANGVSDASDVFDVSSVPVPVGSGSFIFLPTPDPDPAADKVQIGDNVVTAVIGKGGTATVYKVWNKLLEVYRVVKLLAQDAEVERFETEAKIIAKLSHENIVDIYTSGVWNGRPYMEMAFIDGSDLQKIIEERGRLPDIVCVAIAIFVARALEHAHSITFTLAEKQYNGIIHRDIKPANILISKNGAVKLSDFGIARPLEASLHTTGNDNISGTLHYLSPEQMQGNEIDCRSDIYSFGMIMYEMLCGERTFPQTALPEVITQKALNNFKSFDDHGVVISDELKGIVLRCLCQSPADRYQSAGELSSDLQAYYDSITSSDPKNLLKDYFGLPGDTTITDMTLTRALDALRKPKTSAGPMTKSAALEPRAKSKRMLLTALLIFVLAAALPFYAIKRFKTASDSDKDATAAFAAATLAADPTANAAAPDTSDPANGTVHDSAATASSAKRSAPTARAQSKSATSEKGGNAAPGKTNTQNAAPDEAQLMRDAMAAAGSREWNKVIEILEPEGKFKALAGQRTLQLFNAYVESLRFSKAQAIMDTTSLTQDAYFLMCAGKYWRYKGAPDMAIRFFEAAATGTSIVGTRNLLPHGAYFYIAELRQERYNANPSPTNKSAALEAWRKVSASLETNPANPMKKVADRQITALSD